MTTFSSPAPSADADVVVPAACIVCTQATATLGSCCSRACAQAARRELELNVVTIKQLAGGADGERRDALVVRNGELSAALIRWRVDSA